MLFAAAELDDVRRFYRREGTPPTRLAEAPGLARSLGLGELFVKDETARFGLPAFKIVGVRYAVARLVAEAPGIRALAAATAGNHGRAVARAASEHGLAAHVFVPAGTTAWRRAAIADEGAHVVVSTGNYDAAVREMAAAADGQGWTIVSDTAWPGYDTIPRWIMAGYTEIFEEAAAAWTDPPDVVVIQAGVGSLAGAAAAWLHARFGSASRPKLVVAEPTESAVVAASLAAGRRVLLAETGETTMVGLRSGEVSSIVWPVLQATVDAAVTVSDDDAARATEALARLDPPIHAGPSGSAGLAGLTRLIADPALHALRRRLSLGRSARCLVVATEGAPPGSA